MVLLGRPSNNVSIGIVGMPNIGKCFAPGTRIRLMNGDTIAVENVVGGELLMGDDSTPRVVTVGSLTHGRAPMFRIEPGWEGAKPFTVNGAHTLVLVNNSRPCKWEVPNRPNSRWRVQRWELTTDNRLVHPTHNTLRVQLADRLVLLVRQLLVLGDERVELRYLALQLRALLLRALRVVQPTHA